jgi:hypothetical protein
MFSWSFLIFVILLVWFFRTFGVQIAIFIAMFVAALAAIFILGEGVNLLERFWNAETGKATAIYLLVAVLACGLFLYMDFHDSFRKKTWVAWWKRYRIVAGFRSPLFVLAHAPYLWLAKLRSKQLPLSRVQERKMQNNSESKTIDFSIPRELPAKSQIKR